MELNLKFILRISFIQKLKLGNRGDYLKFPLEFKKSYVYAKTLGVQ